MIRTNEKLTILHDDNSSFAEYSNELLDYSRGSASLTFVTAEDSLYVGFYKPINVFYSDMSTVNANAATMTVKYYNGTAFTACVGLHDDSEALTRSGFTRWDRNQLTEAVTTINSVELFWYKIDLSVDSSAMVINGLNIVFSDEQDLKRVLFEVDKYYPTGETSHILTHAGARDEIVQQLNLTGQSKVNSAGRELDISAFDLLDISEVKLASTYLVLSMIMMNMSDDIDDIYMNKHSHYLSKYNKIINVMKIRVDSDDDGLDDGNTERENLTFGFIKRL